LNYSLINDLYIAGETMNLELKPFPFCGCSVSVNSNRDWLRVVGEHAESCPVDGNDDLMITPASDSQLILLVRDWNQRATPPCTLNSECDGRNKAVTELAEFMEHLSGGVRHFAGAIIDAGWKKVNDFSGGEPVVIARVESMYGDPEAFAERELRSLVDLQKLKIGTELIQK
jgi:hypothetical protein